MKNSYAPAEREFKLSTNLLEGMGSVAWFRAMEWSCHTGFGPNGPLTKEDIDKFGNPDCVLK